MSDLSSHLRTLAAEPWQVGWSDCAGMVARWLVICGHPSATLLLPPVGDQAAADAMLAAAGGLGPAMASALAALGLAETEAPRPGDVACVSLATGETCAALRLAGGWALRQRTGVAIVRTAVVASFRAWRV